MGKVLGTVGSIAGGAIGSAFGPAGTAIGSSIGGSLGGKLGGSDKRSAGGQNPSGYTTTEVLPWLVARPYLEDALGKANERFDKGMMAPAAYTGPRFAGASQNMLDANALDATRARRGSPLNASAQALNRSTLDGQYLDPRSNPGFAQGLDDVMDAYMLGTAAPRDAAASYSKNFGGSAHRELVDRDNQNFSTGLNRVLGDMYNTERGRQMQAMTLAPALAQQDYADIDRLRGVGQQERALTQGLFDSYQDEFREGQQWQTDNFANYLNAINSIAGRGSAAKQPYYNNQDAENMGIGSLLGGMLGGSGGGMLGGSGGGLQNIGYGISGMTGYNPVAAATGLPWSDIRLKEDITPIGRRNGLELYRYRYKSDPRRRLWEGVMAQDLLDTHPQAVREVDGYYAVDYSQLGIELKEVANA